VLVTLAEASPITVAAWRLAYALPCLLLACLVRAPARRALVSSGWRRVAALGGAAYAADLLLWNVTILRVGAGPATLLPSSQVVWVTLYGVAVLGERPARRFWLALPLLATGMMLVCGLRSNDLAGSMDAVSLACGTAAGLAYAVYLIAIRRVQRRADVPAEATLAVAIAAAFAIVVALGGGRAAFAGADTWEQQRWLLGLGLGVQVVAWTAITWGLAHLPGHHGALLLFAQPAGSVLLGWLVLGQTLTAGQILGAALVLAGLAAALSRSSVVEP
jgi:drug/metabolite transporter (DMT)-like permease